MALPFVDLRQPLLDARFPLPLDRPFTFTQAAAAGIRSTELTRLVRVGLVRRMVPGVYVAAQATDTLELRVEALRLVVPPEAVVTDRTAGWLHGSRMTLAPGDHLLTPPLSVFDRKRGGRLRNDLTSSGQRMMDRRHVMEVHGLAVTTPLRTACDLGRLLHRDAAFAALDAMLALEVFDLEELCAEIEYFKGYRGVRQLRALAPEADKRSQSMGESVLRRRWLDCPGLPRPEPQVEVPGPDGQAYALDLGVRELRFAAEYDGERFHGPDRAEHDGSRRDWITGELLWTVRVLRKANLFGVHADAESILQSGIRAARAALGDPRTII
jgi:hypothetical protein